MLFAVVVKEFRKGKSVQGAISDGNLSRLRELYPLSTLFEFRPVALLENRPLDGCLVCRVVGSHGRECVDFGVAESVAVAFQGQHVGVMDDPVDHRGRDDVVAEHVSPARERQV